MNSFSPQHVVCVVRFWGRGSVGPLGLGLGAAESWMCEVLCGTVHQSCRAAPCFLRHRVWVWHSQPLQLPAGHILQSKWLFTEHNIRILHCNASSFEIWQRILSYFSVFLKQRHVCLGLYKYDKSYLQILDATLYYSNTLDTFSSHLFLYISWKSCIKQQQQLIPSLWPTPVTWRWGTTLRSTNGWREWQRRLFRTKRQRMRNIGWGRRDVVFKTADSKYNSGWQQVGNGHIETSVPRNHIMQCQQNVPSNIPEFQSNTKGW